jgi:hypothetical protein
MTIGILNEHLKKHYIKFIDCGEDSYRLMFLDEHLNNWHKSFIENTSPEYVIESTLKFLCDNNSYWQYVIERKRDERDNKINELGL